MYSLYLTLLHHQLRSTATTVLRHCSLVYSCQIRRQQQHTKALFTQYNLLSNRSDNQVNICIHNTTSCQTGLTTGCIVYTNIQPVGLTTGCIVYTAGCQTSCTTGCIM